MGENIKPMILETQRMYLRELTQDDFSAICKILKDEEVMYAYEHAFSDEEVHDWLDRQLARYRNDGFGLWGAVLRETNELIGQCGITMQEAAVGRVPEIGYLFQKRYWHQGFAIEAAFACKQYGFQTLGFQELYSIIRDNNVPSRKVAERNGMEIRGTFVKHYYGIEMPHFIYSIKV